MRFSKTRLVHLTPKIDFIERCQESQELVFRVAHEADKVPLYHSDGDFQVVRKEDASHPPTSTHDRQEPAGKNAAAKNAAANETAANETAADSVEIGGDDSTDLPIDLANALGIAGANNLDIRFARERVVAAQADYGKARFLWLPSIRLGLGFNKHDG